MAHPRERKARIGGISRRDFLRRSAGAALAYPTAAAILAACGHASNPDAPSGPSPSASSAFPLARPDHPVTWPLYDDNPAIESNLQPESNATLKIYNWEDYLWPRLCKKFAKEFNCDFEISTFGGVDEALSKIRTGQIDFDIYFPDTSLDRKSTRLNSSHIPLSRMP